MKKRLDNYEGFAQEVADIIMDENTEDVEYDSWYCYSSENSLNVNFSNVIFRFEYSHDDDQGINKLEEKMYNALEKNRDYLTKIIQKEIEKEGE